MFVAVLAGFAAALIVPWLHGRVGDRSGWLVALVPLGLTIYLGTQLNGIANGETVGATSEWVPSLGVDLAFHLDGLSLLFALIITSIGTLVIIYGGGYLKGDPLLGRFYAYILIFMGAMLGVVLANNLITLFVFWELTSISSYLLIGFKHDKADSRQSALQALLVTGSGGLALLGGLVLLGHVAGTNTISALAAQGNLIRDDGLYGAILILVLLGAFTKSAQFPFHFWLPGAMAAPTPVSAYLHSATMVKAGIYLLARLQPVLGGTDAWQIALTGVGAATMTMGAFIAWRQTDLKRILAYSTVSALGMLVLLLGMGTEYAVKAAITLLLAHSLYKGALFLVAGSLDHETGTRDVALMGGLWRKMPWTGTAALVVAASMAGIVPLFGFISKEVFYKAAYDAPDAAAVLTGLVVFSSVLLVAAAGLVSLKPFLGTTGRTPQSPHEAPLSMTLGPLLLAGLSVGFGIVPGPVTDYVVKGATQAALNDTSAKVELVLWPGINTVLLLSFLTIIAGLGVYAGRKPLQRRVGWLDAGERIGPARAYRALLDGMLWLADRQTRILQNGYLRVYLITIVTVTTGLVGYTLLAQTDLDGALRSPDVRVYELLIAGVILAATLAVTQAQSRLAAVAALGTVGYGIALLYILFGAPDLAMTQFAIETLTVLLFVLVIYRLPRFGRISSPVVRVRDATIAISAGAMMTLLVLIVTADPARTGLTSYFAENSVTEAKGRNIVNVILVDFRALDTLGEIVVLAVAAAGVYSLLKLRPDREIRNRVSAPRSTVEMNAVSEDRIEDHITELTP
ncbi:MAG: putative monovalent cation/H+ antiporter subunit A [Chloroflexi bacterium]|nr:putative monovalent cation/H+ antiporter subunit A [Chloroflexota bacterium]